MHYLGVRVLRQQPTKGFVIIKFAKFFIQVFIQILKNQTTSL